MGGEVVRDLVAKVLLEEWLELRTNVVELSTQGWMVAEQRGEVRVVPLEASEQELQEQGASLLFGAASQISGSTDHCLVFFRLATTHHL